MDTDAGSNLTQIALIPSHIWHFIRPPKNHVSVRNKSNGVVVIAGTINLVFNVWNGPCTTVMSSMVNRLGAEISSDLNFAKLTQGSLPATSYRLIRRLPSFSDHDGPTWAFVEPCTFSK